MPYITSQYRSPSILNTLRSYIAQVPLAPTYGRFIDLAPWPKSINEKGIVTFTENGRPEAEVMRSKICKPDIMILATGYTQSFPFLDSTYPMPQEANIRLVWKENDETVAFIGFIRPSFGAIPPLSEMQAQLWTLNLLRRLPAPLKPESHYKLRPPPNSRINYGVDHESYAYQLALDMGSAPSYTEILPMGLKMVACWALSAQVNTKFRLMGPWKWEGAKEVMEREIWDTVRRRRGFFGHITLSVVPMVVFGSLSAVLWVLDGIFKLLKLVWKELV